MAHLTHPDIILRLKRAEGHMRSTIAMIEQGRACPELAQQLQAIEKSISVAKKTLIHDHIDHCLETQVGPDVVASRRALKDFKEITKYL